MPTLPWCVGPIGAGGTPQSSEIPQPPPDSKSNEIETQESSDSDSPSGSLDSSQFFSSSSFFYASLQCSGCLRSFDRGGVGRVQRDQRGGGQQGSDQLYQQQDSQLEGRKQLPGPRVLF